MAHPQRTELKNGGVSYIAVGKSFGKLKSEHCWKLVITMRETNHDFSSAYLELGEGDAPRN